MSTSYTQQPEYIESCIKSSIAEIANLDRGKISLLLQVSNQCYADMLSEISVMTKIAYFAIDNYANINSDTLSSLMENEKLVFAKGTFSNTNIGSIQAIIKTFTNSLSSAQDELITVHNLTPGSLNMFNSDAIEANVNFKQGEQSSPLMFKYYEGKITLNIAIKLIKVYTDLKDIFDSNRKSLSILTTDKAGDVLVYFQNTIKGLVQDLNDIQFIIDSSKLACLVFDKFLLSNDKYYNSFLSRNYDTIRNDVVGCYLQLYPPSI